MYDGIFTAYNSKQMCRGTQLQRAAAAAPSRALRAAAAPPGRAIARITLATGHRPPAPDLC